MTRGRRGSLALRRRALPSPPPCRFIPALSHNPDTGLPAPLRVLCSLTSGNRVARWRKARCWCPRRPWPDSWKRLLIVRLASSMPPWRPLPGVTGLTGIATLGHLHFTPIKPARCGRSRSCQGPGHALSGQQRRSVLPSAGNRPDRALPIGHCRSVIAARKEDRGQRAQGPAVLRGSSGSVPPLQAARDLVFAAPPFNLAASPDAWSCCSRHVHGKIG
jgi:hypothetical protein